MLVPGAWVMQLIDGGPLVVCDVGTASDNTAVFIGLAIFLVVLLAVAAVVAIICISRRQRSKKPPKGCSRSTLSSTVAQCWMVKAEIRRPT